MIRGFLVRPWMYLVVEEANRSKMFQVTVPYLSIRLMQRDSVG